MAALPDVPRWVYARSLLLSGAAPLRLGTSDAVLVQDPATAVLVGQANSTLLREALAGNPPGQSLLVQEEALTAARAALPSWTARWFVVHALSRPVAPDTPPAPGVVVSAPLDRAALAGLPDDVCADAADAADAAAAAVRVVDGVPVAVCFVSDLTETLWDVGVDTIESARRQGHAAAVFIALAAAMAAQGRQPVWAAYEDYWPSLALAARLGFWPVARMVELVPPDGGETAAREAVTGSRT